MPDLHNEKLTMQLTMPGGMGEDKEEEEENGTDAGEEGTATTSS